MEGEVFFRGTNSPQETIERRTRTQALFPKNVGTRAQQFGVENLLIGIFRWKDLLQKERITLQTEKMTVVRPPEFREEEFEIGVVRNFVFERGERDRDLCRGFSTGNHSFHYFRFTLEKCFSFIEAHALFQ